MSAINYEGRQFRGRSNSEGGEVSGETRFEYHQEGDLLWGRYTGGSVEEGHLLGTVHPEGTLSFCYHHRNTDGVLMAGRCESRPRWEGKQLVLEEAWQWLTGDQSRGSSEVEEVTF